MKTNHGSAPNFTAVSEQWQISSTGPVRREIQTGGGSGLLFVFNVGKRCDSDIRLNERHITQPVFVTTQHNISSGSSTSAYQVREVIRLELLQLNTSCQIMTQHAQISNCSTKLKQHDEIFQSNIIVQNIVHVPDFHQNS